MSLGAITPIMGDRACFIFPCDVDEKTEAQIFSLFKTTQLHKIQSSTHCVFYYIMLKNPNLQCKTLQNLEDLTEYDIFKKPKFLIQKKENKVQQGRCSCALGY